MRNPLLRLLAIATAVGVLACAGESLSPVKATARLQTDGVYQLVTVNGYGLPAITHVIPPWVFKIRAGIIRLATDATFSDSLFGSALSPFPYPDGTFILDSSETRGTWTYNGTDLLTFTTYGGGQYSFAVSWNAIERTITRSYGPDLTLRYEIVGGSGQIPWLAAPADAR